MPTSGQMPAFELVSSGVDWFTCTTKIGPRAVEVYDRAMRIIDQEEKAGCGRKPWSFSGYRGWVSAHIGVGRRLDGVIVRISGDVAHGYWRGFFAQSDNVSRLDLAVTATSADPGYPVALCAHRDFARWRKDHDRRVQRTYIDGGEHGCSFYVGSRSSERYGRIYDKYAETGEPYARGTWRWEVELKGALAFATASDLLHEKNRPEALGRLTMAFFAEKGISVPFGPSGVQWRYEVSRARIPIERRLAWLEEQVRPSVQEMCHLVGEKTVLDALGLWHDNCVESQKPIQARLLEVKGVSG